MIRTISLDKAVGLPLAHDITEIRPWEFKGAAFQRGHVVRHQDLDHLRRLGKENIFVLELEADELHEDEAAVKIAEALCGEGIVWENPPQEGKINLKATRNGLLKVAVDALACFNALGDIICATQHTNTLVERGQIVAATRAIPLVIKRARVELAVKIAGGNGAVLRVLPIRQAKVGVLITGNEVYYGRIQDRFAPIISRKVRSLNGEIMDTTILPDDDEQIAGAALEFLQKGADILIITGGMSVDPDDRTLSALLKAGAEDLLYGAAVLPGAMFVVAYLQNVPVLGIPACGLYHQATVFDLIYPRILAGERITRADLASLGHGGLCLKCEVCHYPACPFGKGV